MSAPAPVIYSGKHLLHEVFDLIQHRLPSIPADDPHHETMSWFLGQLGRRLDRVVA